MNGRVLVTGGLGYLGGRIVQALSGEGEWMVSTTSRRTASDVPGDDSALQLVLPCEPRTAAGVVCGCDAVVHLAAMNEIQCARDPEEALRVNGLGTLQLLNAAIHAGVRRFVYLSTAHVYGSALWGLVTEATLPRPNHPYAISHHVAENFVLSAHAAGQIDGVVLRVSNGIGAPVRLGIHRWTLVGNDLCRQAVDSGCLHLHSGGFQWRDFVPLSRVTAAVAHMLRLPRAALDDGLFNLGGDLPMRIIDVAEKVAERANVVLGRPVRLDVPRDQDAGSERSLDFRNDKLFASGFTYVGNLDEEIDRTLRLCMAGAGTSA